MTDPTVTIAMATASLAGLGMVTAAGLAGWRGWLQLKQQQMVCERGGAPAAPPTAAARIELADLKERIRKLEAIAAGVEL